jgi:hypothetical protein
MASCSDTGVPHFRSVARAAAYQSGLASKMAHALSTSLGAVVEQLSKVSTQRPITAPLQRIK